MRQEKKSTHNKGWLITAAKCVPEGYHKDVCNIMLEDLT
jgi:hypothetical protein